MKRTVNHVCTAMAGVLAVAGNFAVNQWLFGRTAAVSWLIIQLCIGAWGGYGLGRAPVCGDRPHSLVVAMCAPLGQGNVEIKKNIAQ